MKKIAACSVMILWLCGNVWALMTDSVSQYGITWKFDKPYLAGTFANGDYWVLGPVIITSITPNFTGTWNG